MNKNTLSGVLVLLMSNSLSLQDSFWNGFWVGTASSTAGGLLVVLIAWLAAQLFKRFSQRNLNKVERLEAQLKQHRMERRNLGAVALNELIFVILYTILAVTGIVSLQTITMGESLTLLSQDSTPQREEIRAALYPLYGVVAVLTVWFMAAFFGSIRTFM